MFDFNHAQEVICLGMAENTPLCPEVIHIFGHPHPEQFRSITESK